VKGKGHNLFGRDWLAHFRLDWKTIGLATLEKSSTPLEMLLERYADVFADGLGTMQHFQAKLHVKENTRPIFHRPRPVPFANKGTLEGELKRLESAGIIEKVSHSDWEAPIVTVPKGDGKLRICGDYKVTINPYLDIDQYPLPKPDDLFTSLAGGQKFSKIDLTQAYQQMVLDE